MCDGKRAFLEQHRLQPPAVIFEQLGRAEVARDQDRIPGEPVCAAVPIRPETMRSSRFDRSSRSCIRSCEQRIVDFLHSRAGALLNTLDRRLGGEAAVDRLVDPPRPALVIGEHPVGLEDLLMLAGRAELRVARHIVDLLAHLAEGRIDPVALGLDVLGDRMLDHDARLVEHGLALGHAGDQLEPGEPQRTGAPQASAACAVDQPRAGDHFGQDHGHGLQRLDLDVLVAPRLGMLDGEHADRAFEAHDRNAGEAVETLFARFRLVKEGRVLGRLGEVEDAPFGGDGADQALAHAQARTCTASFLRPWVANSSRKLSRSR